MYPAAFEYHAPATVKDLPLLRRSSGPRTRCNSDDALRSVPDCSRSLLGGLIG